MGQAKKRGTYEQRVADARVYCSQSIEDDLRFFQKEVDLSVGLEMAKQLIELHWKYSEKNYPGIFEMSAS